MLCLQIVGSCSYNCRKSDLEWVSMVVVKLGDNIINVVLHKNSFWTFYESVN